MPDRMVWVLYIRSTRGPRKVNLKVLKMAHFPIQMRSLAFEDQ